jgi:GT2 family glycosyltransferase
VSHRDDNAPVFDAARRALADHLHRTGIEGDVEQVHASGVYRIRRRLTDAPHVTVVIPTRGSRSVVRGAERVLVVEAVRTLLERSTYPRFDVVVVADGPTPPEVRDAVVALAPDRIRVVDYPYPFNYAEKINLGAVRARGDLLLFLNDDTEIVTPDWLETMVGLLGPDVGMVGAKLLYEDGAIQHLGLHVGKGDVAHIGEGEPDGTPGPFSDYWLDREASGVTGACALVPRHVFDEVGGLSRAFPVNFNDVDFGFKILDAGYRILVTPHAVLHHFESRTRTRGVTATEVFALRDRWSRRLATDDFWRHEVRARRLRVTRPAVASLSASSVPAPSAGPEASAG